MDMKRFLTGIILAALILCFSLSETLAQDVNIYDKDWRLKGRVRDGKIYGLDMKVEGYIKEGRIYDQNWMLKGFIEGDRIFNPNRHAQGYIKKGGDGPSTEEGRSKSR